MLAFRYIAIIAFGVFVAIGKKKLSIWFYLLCLGISITYIYLTMYKGLDPIITKWWIGTSLWACLYIIPIMSFVVNKKMSFFPLEIIGRASYHIF